MGKEKVEEPVKVCLDYSCRENPDSSCKTLKIKVPERIFVARRELLTPAFTGAGLLSIRGMSFQESLKHLTFATAENIHDRKIFSELTAT